MAHDLSSEAGLTDATDAVPQLETVLDDEHAGVRNSVRRRVRDVEGEETEARFEVSVEGEQRLEGLRKEMNRILKKETVRLERVVRDVERALSELPFVIQETDDGRRFSRRRKIAEWETTGRVPLHAHRTATHSLLGPLSLDESLDPGHFRRALFLDTETTGLSGGTGTVAFLLGLAYVENDELFVEQIFLPSYGEEVPMLRYLRERIESADVIVSFNGKSFDWPLLRTRFVMNRVAPPRQIPHCDLLHVARRIHKERLSDMRLQTIERDVLGLERIGDIEGALIATVFGHFLRTGDGEGVRRVVEHNEQDVLSMVALLAVYGSIDPTALDDTSVLESTDFLGIANTLRRARKLEEAEAVVSQVIAKNPCANAHRTRAVIAKAQKNSKLAAADYHASLEMEPSASVHLELSKLYEHKLKNPQQALLWALEGTSEGAELARKREGRLRKKLETK